MDPRTVAWSRTDIPGMDACRILPDGNGWLIEGTALFVDGTSVSNLSYRIACADDWSSRAARVAGWAGARPVDLTLAREAGGGWTVNGHPVETVRGLPDIDLGFSPASNTNTIRRLKLRDGQEREISVAWLDTADWTLKPLAQIYRRLSATTYFYASPSHSYHAHLEVDDFGIVRHYPGLWTAQPGK